LHHHIRKTKPFNLLSFIALVVTSCVGADIYIIISQTSQLSGSASIWAWVICAMIALTIAVSFAQCAKLVGESGGTFIYVEKAFGHFWGFMSGWIMYLSMCFALIVYPIAFVHYIHYFFEPNPLIDGVIKTVFIVFFTYINIKGSRITAKADNIITGLKLLPLLVLVVLGIVWFALNPQIGIANLTASKPDSFLSFGEVILFAFWAYTGFEMSVLPASEIQSPKKNIPRGLIIGVLIVAAFYLAVNITVFTVIPENLISNSSLPLVTAISNITGNPGMGLVIIAGGLVSISGITLATIFELSRLLQKMAKENLFPKFFSKAYGEEKVPIAAIMIQSSIALIVSLFANINTIIGFSVILTALIYFMTALANWKLHSRARKFEIKYRIVAIFAMLFSIFLIFQATIIQLALSAIVLLFGLLWYRLRKPKITSKP